MSGLRTYVIGVVVALIGALAVGAVVEILGRESDPFVTRETDSPVGIAPVSITVDGSVQATLSLSVSSRRSVLSARNGIVTAVKVEAGGLLSGGEVVLTIDDEPIFAFRSEAPLVRRLALGDAGPDVARLQEFLGLFDDIEVDGRFGPSTARAVLAFREERSLSQEESIGPEDFLWFGPSDYQVEAVEVSVGTHVAAGDVMLVGPPDGIEYDIQAAPLDPRSAWVISVEGGSTPISSDLKLSDMDATALYRIVGESETVPAAIHLASPISAYEVPASAIWSDSFGTCVFAEVATQPTPVDVLSVAFGKAQLQPTTALPESIVVNPTSLIDPSCRG